MTNLLEVISKFDDRSRFKHPLLIDNKLPVLQRVDVTLDKEKIRTTLDGQEPASGNVNTMAVLEVLDSGTSSCLKLRRFGNTSDVSNKLGTVAENVPG